MFDASGLVMGVVSCVHTLSCTFESSQLCAALSSRDGGTAEGCAGVIQVHVSGGVPATSGALHPVGGKTSSHLRSAFPLRRC